MVTILKLEKSNIKGEGKFLAQLVGLSGDDKPDRKSTRLNSSHTS